MRILICGGRDFTNEHALFSVMDGIIDYWWPRMEPISGPPGFRDRNPPEIISGMARGADTLAVKYAKDRRLALHPFPADWEKHGSKAGYLRNCQMLEEGKPDLVVAFPGGKGTAMMVRLSEQAGVKVIVSRDPMDDL